MGVACPDSILGHALSRIVTRKMPVTQPETRMAIGFAGFLGQIVKKKAEAHVLRRVSCALRYPYIYIHFLVNS